MRMQFLSKYREAGLLLLRVSLGLLFIYITAPALMGGSTRLAHFGAGIRILGLHSHFQLWGTIGALAGCLGGAQMVFGLFFRIGVLFVLAISLVHAIAIEKSAAGFAAALPVAETCVVLISLLFIGPGKFSVDKN